MESILSYRSKTYISFANDAKAYFADMENVVRSYNNDDFTFFNDSVALLHKYSKTILEKQVSILDFLNLFDVFENANRIMKRMLDILNNDFYNRGIYYDKSATCSFEYDIKRKKILDIYDKNMARYQPDNNVIFKFITDKFPLNVDCANQFKHILLDKHYTNDLAIYLAKGIIDIVDIQSTVEYLKDISLGTKDAKDNFYPLAYRHRLFPITDSMPIENLMNYLKLEYNKKKSFEQINSSGKGIIIIRKIFKNPVRYNILSLVSPFYIDKNKLTTSPDSGLNTRIIRRFNTIYTLDQPSNIPDKNVCVEKHIRDKGKLAYPENYVIETFNDKQYHLLSNNFSCPYVSANIAEHVGEITRRPITYNTDIIDKMIFGNTASGFNTPILLEYDSEKTQLFEASVFKLNIKNGIIKRFEEQYNLMKATDYKDILSDKSIWSYVIGKVLYKDLNPSNKGIEFTITYVKNIDNIVMKFNLALNSELNKFTFPEKYYKNKTDDDVRIYIVESFKKMLDNALNELDSSLWMDLGTSLKLFMMKKSLLIAY